MSDFVASADALRAHLTAGFTALPCYWPNGDTEPTLEAAPNGFVYGVVALQDERQISLGLEGERWHRDFGEFAVFVYVPRNSRLGAAEQYAESIRALFKTTEINGIIVTRRTIGRGREVDGPGAMSRVYCVPVFIEWFSDRLE